MELKEYEKRQKKVQKKLERLLAKEGMAMVANYNKDTNVVMLELVPLEVLADRNAILDQMMKEKGDAITPIPTQ